MFRKTVMSTSDPVVLFDVGVGQAQGSRKYQEDRCTIVLPDQFPGETKDKIAFFAIYDGHGSALVSEHASKRLHYLLAKRPEFEKGDYAAAIKAALADEDALLLESFKHDTAEPAISGSTAALCLVNLTQGELVVSNLGDSHVILAERDPKTNRPYHICRLTEAHKPELPSEKQRIEEAGGQVSTLSGTARLVGSLNMSRALGDLQYKNPVNEGQDQSSWPGAARRGSSSSAPVGNFLSNDPFTSRRTLQADRRYLLVIVSDGVSDHTEDVALIQHVMKLAMRGKRASEIASEVATNNARFKKSDNASCVVVMLDGQRS
ncbi:Protein phosphatase 2C [Penicillium verhagenii]|uniref:Protein phosphatase 2C n=1 Tax=Penicillium verhagenii TaxID=1562060 RepID=UPI002545A55D|nr:Protein phosphatase 2C [Penicillium verhagenii]KAJ5920882.1 Protein phosphatase 2C [Penicillium verhagenii]